MDYSQHGLLSQDASPSLSPPPYNYSPSAPPQNYPPQGPGMHPPYAPTPGGQPYYPYQGTSYPGPQQHQQQQQQQTVVVVGNQPAVTPGSTISFAGAIKMSCLVFWCCGVLFGGIAFILALAGQSHRDSGQVRSAIRLRNASYGMSVAGFVCGIIIIIAVAVSVQRRQQFGL